MYGKEIYEDIDNKDLQESVTASYLITNDDTLKEAIRRCIQNNKFDDTFDAYKPVCKNG